MTFATLLTLISSVALLILIAATALSKHKTSQSRYLLVLLVSILVWTDAIYISNIQISSVIDLFTNRLVFSLVPLYVLAFYRLVGTFRGENGRTKRNRTDNIITVLLVISIILSVATASIVSDVNYDKATSRYDIIPGPLYIPFLVSTVSFVIAAIVDLLRLQRVLVGVARSRVRILAFSTLLLTILVVISNAIIPRLTGSSEFASLAPLWIFVWLSLMSYSIFKHRLFDIYYVLGRIVYFTIAAFLLYLEFYAVFFVGKLFLGGSTSPTGYSFGLIFAVVASLLNYYFNQNISQKLSEFMSYFSFNPEDILRSYSKEVSTSLSIDQIATSTLSSLKHSINPLSFGIYIVDPIQKKISHAVFFLEGTTSKIKDPSLLFDICSEWENDNNVAPLILEELTGTTLEPNSQLKTIADEMKKNNISASFALNSQQNTTGILVLGEKLNKLAYSTQDISFLENFSAILSVSLSRALLHQEVQEFNVTLQKKVDDATQKLQVRNTELRDLYNNLEEIYQKEKDLMDVAGHEFRTPASILKNNLYLLKKRLQELYPDSPDEKIEKYLDRLIEGTDRQIKLVNTFLESARIDNKRFEIQVETKDLAEMGESAVADIKGLAKKKGLEVTFRNPGKKIFAEVDVVRVREVIDNLLSNSVKYTKAGYIEVSITEDDASIAFSIKDTGIGIKKEDQALLFKKFSRVENYIGGEEGSIVRPGGTGLGLYVAKTIVDAHSGTLTVESEIGKGSTFTFTIPKHQPSYVRRTEGPQQKYVPTHVTLPGDITTETADVKTGAVSAILHQTQKPETPAASTPQPDAPPQADDEPK